MKWDRIAAMNHARARKPASGGKRIQAARRAKALPRKAQQPMDIGLFSDDAAQLDLIEMFADPTND